MATTMGVWTPPAGMDASVVKGWRAFYARAMDTYQITPRDYRRLYVAQKGRCWICRTAKGIHPADPKGRGGRRLGIDHDHLSGVVRGLLCTGGDKTCNRVIGWLDHAALKRAVAYLERPPARVLGEMANVEYAARREGITLSEDEMDYLAVSYLWPDPV